MTTARPPQTRRPRKLTTGQELAAGVALVLVAAAGSTVAVAFRGAGAVILAALVGDANPTNAAADTSPALVFAVVAGAVVVAAWAGHRTARRSGEAVGLTSLALAARGKAPPPSARATASRGAGTFVAVLGLVSVGRESAILEAAGTIGAQVERRIGHLRGALTAAGMSAAFAAAYHAPVAAVLYVEEHLGVRRNRRSVAYTLAGAAISRELSATLFGSGPILPHHRGGLGGAALLGAIAIVPATLGGRLFLHVRDRTAVAAREHLPSPARVAALALVVAALVSAAPLTAGNGLEALRAASDHPTLTVALTLAAVKLAATSAALASGVPGGAFSPTMALSAGWGLLAFFAVGAVGVGLPAELWDGMLLAMVAGVAVGLQAPLTAAFAIPEMAGDLALLPLAIATAAAAAGLDVAVGRGRKRWQRARLARLHDEDA